MEFHSDYYKLRDAGDIMEKVPPLKRQLDQLRLEKSENESIIDSNWQDEYCRDSTYNYDTAYENEVKRVDTATKAAQSKAHIRRTIISSILQLIALLAIIVILFPNMQDEASEMVMVCSAAIFFWTTLNQILTNIGTKIGSIIFLVCSSIYLIDIALLDGAILGYHYEPSLIAPAIGIIQTALGWYFVLSVNHIHCHVDTIINEDLLQKAREADNADNRRARETLKKDFEARQETAKKSISNIDRKIKELEKTIEGLMSDIKAVGILRPEEYTIYNEKNYSMRSIADVYANHIYLKTMETGIPKFDIEYARHRESEIETEKIIAESKAQWENDMRKIKQNEEFSARLDQLFAQQENRRIISDLNRTVENATEKAEELRKELEKFRD